MPGQNQVIAVLGRRDAEQSVFVRLDGRQGIPLVVVAQAPGEHLGAGDRLTGGRIPDKPSSEFSPPRLGIAIASRLTQNGV